MKVGVLPAAIEHRVNPKKIRLFVAMQPCTVKPTHRCGRLTKCAVDSAYVDSRDVPVAFQLMSYAECLLRRSGKRQGVPAQSLHGRGSTKEHKSLFKLRQRLFVVPKLLLYFAFYQVAFRKVGIRC